MKKLCIIILLIGISITPTSAQKTVADIVFTNGKIYTVNNENLFAEAVAVKAGKLLGETISLEDAIRVMTLSMSFRQMRCKTIRSITLFSPERHSCLLTPVLSQK